MNLAEIKQLNIMEPFCFESSQEEEWYECGLYKGAQIAEEELINKACEYLRTHLWQNVDADNDPIVESIQNIPLDNFIRDFKRYLEE